MIHVYVNYPNKFPNYSTIGEAIAHISKDYILPEAAYPAPLEDIEPATIHIAPGTYRELLVLERPHVTLLGESPENTVLVYGNCAQDIMEDGSRRGTFRSASVRIHTHDVSAVSLTFQNDAGFGHDAGQALALYVDGDWIQFHSCKMIGSQDTLFTAPLPLKEAQPGGFIGPGEHIHPEGWTDWNKPLGHFYYGEYQSYGPGAAPEKRVSYSHQLNDSEASVYTMENVLQGWYPEHP